MKRFLVRFTIVFTSLYFILSCGLAQIYGVDILRNWHCLLFELCVVLYTFSEGAFHCKYMRYTAISILICDLITQLDNAYDFLTVEAHNLIPIALLVLGISASCTLAIRHFYQVTKLKRKKKSYEYKIKRD